MAKPWRRYQRLRPPKTRMIARSHRSWRRLPRDAERQPIFCLRLWRSLLFALVHRFISATASSGAAILGSARSPLPARPRQAARSCIPRPKASPASLWNSAASRRAWSSRMPTSTPPCGRPPQAHSSMPARYARRQRASSSTTPFTTPLSSGCSRASRVSGSAIRRTGASPVGPVQRERRLSRPGWQPMFTASLGSLRLRPPVRALPFAERLPHRSS